MPEFSRWDHRSLATSGSCVVLCFVVLCCVLLCCVVLCCVVLCCVVLCTKSVPCSGSWHSKADGVCHTVWSYLWCLVNTVYCLLGTAVDQSLIELIWLPLSWSNWIILICWEHVYVHIYSPHLTSSQPYPLMAVDEENCVCSYHVGWYLETLEHSGSFGRWFDQSGFNYWRQSRWTESRQMALWLGKAGQMIQARRLGGQMIQMNQGSSRWRDWEGEKDDPEKADGEV